MSRTPDFEALFRYVPGLYLVLGTDLTIVAASDAYLTATMTKRGAIVGRGIFDVFPDNPADPTADGVRNLRASLERVIARGVPDRMPIQKYDIRLPNAGDVFEVRYWSPLNSPVLGPEGGVELIIHQVEDVTELVTLRHRGVEHDRVEAALRSSNAWFSTILNSIGDAVVAIDIAGAILFMNPAARELTGWSWEEARGRLAREVLHLLDPATGYELELPIEGARRPDTKVPTPRETLLRTRDGRRVPIEDVAAPINDADGRPIASVIILRDVSRRKSAESEINRLNRQLSRRLDELRTILDIAPVGILVAEDPECSLIVANRAAAVMLGTPVGGNSSESGRDAVTFPYKFLRDREEVPADRLPMQRAAEGIDVDDQVYEIARPDGSVINVLVNARPLRDDDGRVAGSVGIFLDITALRSAELALRAADRRKDEFLAMLAHELRNPLASIRYAIELLRMPEAAVGHADWCKDVIERQIRHLSRLIDDLLDVSRITQGKIDLRKERLEVSPVIDAAVDSIRSFVEAKGQELAVSFSPGTLWCEADPTRLEQVLTNLLINATRYTKAGGKIWLEARHEGALISFAVRDTGMGIPPDKLSEMFELFAQGDRFIARSEGGLGLGLTIVKSIAEMHGGTATAFSEGPGRGSEFTVTLPAIRPVEATIAHAADRGGNRASRILVVEDDVDIARGLTHLLELLGNDVRTAHDGPEALAAAMDFRPEYVLLDIGLPGMDGYEVASRLRGEGFKDALIIAVTGYGQAEDRRRSREAGFDYHLVKPVDFDALVTLIGQTAV
jgi:PAS domain S-box-containing protein